MRDLPPLIIIRNQLVVQQSEDTVSFHDGILKLLVLLWGTRSYGTIGNILSQMFEMVQQHTEKQTVESKGFKLLVEAEFIVLISYVDKPSVLPGSTRTAGCLDPVGSHLPRSSAPGSPCSPCPSSSG